MSEDRLHVVFRCDAAPEIGMGHVVRSAALAEELRDRHGCDVRFAIRYGPLGIEYLRRRGLPVHSPPEGPHDDLSWLESAAGTMSPWVLILDVRDDTPVEAIRMLRERGALIVSLDDPSDRRLAADLAFYPPVPQVKRWSWDGFTGRLYWGWEWVVLRREFARSPERSPNRIPVVLVTAGGSDPAGVTLKAVTALDRLEAEFTSCVVLGAGFLHDQALTEMLARARHRFEVYRNVSEIHHLMARADLAIASFGVTAYELAAMGVPAIHLCLTADHAESASIFADAGIAINLGEHQRVSVEELGDVVSRCLGDLATLAQMSHRARACVDGCGAVRVAREAVRRARS